MPDGTVKVTGGAEVNEFFSRLQSGVNEWTNTPIYVGYGKGGAHGRLLEGGFHPRGSATFVPGIHTLERAKQQALREVKPAVLASIREGAAGSDAAKKHLADVTAERVRALTPQRRTSGRNLRSSVKVIIGGSKRGRR